MTEELERMKITLDKNRFDSGKFEEATTLFEKIILKDTLDEFLTLSAYETLE
jgi:malate synthase